MYKNNTARRLSHLRNFELSLHSDYVLQYPHRYLQVACAFRLVEIA